MLSFLVWLLFIPARRILTKNKPIIIGITGSVGKTTTKDLITQVLSQKYTVQTAKRSFNTPLGLVLTILGFSESPKKNPLKWLSLFAYAFFSPKPRFDVLVLEMGADTPGNIEELVSYIQPHYGLITHVNENHIADGQFNSINQIFEEKTKLITHTSATVWLNGDIELSKQFANHKRVHFCSQDNAQEIHSNKEGLWFTYNNQTYSVPHMYGAFLVPAFTAIIDIARELGLEYKEINQGFANGFFPHGRGNILDGIYQTTIVDSSYNANPEAFMALIDEVASWPWFGRRVLVMGSMNELWSKREYYHELVAKKACEKGFDAYVCIGHSADLYKQKLEEYGEDPDRIEVYEDAYLAGQMWKNRLANKKKWHGALFVVKGSQNKVWTERFISKILAHSKDLKKLCRSV